MKERIKTGLSVCLLIVALPFIITLIFQGNRRKNSDSTIVAFITKQHETEGIPETEGTSEAEKESGKLKDLDVEEYLVGVTANEIPISYEPEMIKAQILIARTNLFRAIENNMELPAALSGKQMLKLWGQKGFTDNYQTLANAVESTRGETIVYDGAYIDAAFHAVSAGKTRTAADVTEKENAVYLTGVDSQYDIPSQDFLKIIFYEKNDFMEVVNTNWKEAEVKTENILSGIEIKQRDSADYVTEIIVGGVSLTGEEFREAFKLNSACFYLAEVDKNIRIVTKGLGHGFGLSQYGGNELAKTGLKYSEILEYYYRDVKIKR